MILAALVLLIRQHLGLSICFGELYLSDEVVLVLAINFDYLSLVGAFIVATLTLLTVVFGVEYMAREAFAYTVLVTLFTFSACIV